MRGGVGNKVRGGRGERRSRSEWEGHWQGGRAENKTLTLAGGSIAGGLKMRELFLVTCSSKNTDIAGHSDMCNLNTVHPN